MAFAAASRGGVADDGKEPGAEARAAGEPGLAVENLQIGDLQHILSLAGVAVAAVQRPAVAGRVVLFQRLPDVGIVHIGLSCSAATEWGGSHIYMTRGSRLPPKRYFAMRIVARGHMAIDLVPLLLDTFSRLTRPQGSPQ